MKKPFLVESLNKYDARPEMVTYRFEIPDGDLPAWCVAICQFRYAMIDSIVIHNEREQLTIALDASKKKSKRIKNYTGRVEVREDRIKVLLSESELQGWTIFYLSKEKSETENLISTLMSKSPALQMPIASAFI